MHWCLVVAYLYEWQTFMAVDSVAQDCCQPVLHSSTEQQGMHFASNDAAMLWCVALLCGWQILVGVDAVAQDRCQLLLHSDAQQQGMRFALNNGTEQQLRLALCCYAKQACTSEITPMNFQSPCRCATTKHQSMAALFKAKCMPYCCVLYATQVDSRLVPM